METITIIIVQVKHTGYGWVNGLCYPVSVFS